MDGFYRFPNYPRIWRDDEDREDVESSETWNGGTGTISLNWLQQHPEGFDPPRPLTPVEEEETTDSHGVATVFFPNL